MNVFNQKPIFRPNPPANPRNKWILRDSKTFPGKLYWFNLLTGEALWTNDADRTKVIPREYPIPQQPYKLFYQEPSSPPYDTGPNSSNIFPYPPKLNNHHQLNNYHQLSNYHHQQPQFPQQQPQFPQHSFYQNCYPNTSPIFGQVSYPRYVPIHRDLSTSLPNGYISQPQVFSQSKSFPTITTYSDGARRCDDQNKSAKQCDVKFTIHTTTVPLHKRFDTYQKNRDDFDVINDNHDDEDNFNVPTKRRRMTVDENDDYFENYDSNYIIDDVDTTAEREQNHNRFNNDDDYYDNDKIAEYDSSIIQNGPKIISNFNVDYNDGNTVIRSDNMQNLAAPNYFRPEYTQDNDFPTFSRPNVIYPPRNLNPTSLQNHTQNVIRINDTRNIDKPNFIRTGVIKENKTTNCTQTCVDIPVTIDTNNTETDQQKEFNNNTNNIINSVSSKVDKETNTDEKAVHKSIFSPTPEANVDAKKIEPNLVLDKDDLRLRLLEKKANGKTTLGEGINSRKRRVTFNLDNITEEGGDSTKVCGYYEDVQPTLEIFDNETQSSSRKRLNTNRLKELSAFPIKDTWYIVVDLDCLLKDFDFLMKIVNSDVKCNLLLPKQVKSSLDDQCKGDCTGRRGVMAARNISREIERKRDKIIVQETSDSSEGELIESIYKCCTEKINKGYFVVLITINAELTQKSKLNNIQTFTLAQIKEFLLDTDRSMPPKYNRITFLDDTKMNLKTDIENDNFLCKTPIEKKDTKISKTNSTPNIENDNFLYKTPLKDPIESNNHSTPKVTRSIPTSSVTNAYTIKDTTQNNENNSFLSKNNESNSFLSKTNTNKSYKIPKLAKTMTKINERGGIIKETLSKFKSVLSEERFKEEREGWVCNLVQILEYGLADVIEALDANHGNSPSNILEAVKMVKLLINIDSEVLTTVINKIYDILSRATVKKHASIAATKEDVITSEFDFEYIKTDIEFNDFVMLYSLGYLLFELFEAQAPELMHICIEMIDHMDDLLVRLKDGVQSIDISHFDDSPKKCEEIKYKEKFILDERHKVTEIDYVLDYLERHYPHLESEIDQVRAENAAKSNSKKNNNNDNIKIIRTVGKNLNNITLDNFTLKDKSKNDINQNNTINNRIDINEYDTGNTFTNDNNNKSTAKVIRNLCLIEEFENRLKKKENETKMINNVNDIDNKANFTKTNEFINQKTNENNTKSVKNVNDKCQNYSRNINDIDIDEESMSKLSNMVTSDSGIDQSNESYNAQSIVKIFLNEIKLLFYDVKSIIESSLKVMRKGDLNMERRDKITQQVSIAMQGIDSLACKMKSIIEREKQGAQNSLKILLVKSEIEQDDVKIYRYRQVLSKCVEQGAILSCVLSMLQLLTKNVNQFQSNASQFQSNNVNINTIDIGLGNQKQCCVSSYNIFE